MASPTGVERHAAAATAGGGLVGVVVAIGYAAGAGAETITALAAVALAVPGLLHGLVAAGGVRGALAQLWRGRGPR